MRRHRTHLSANLTGFGLVTRILITKYVCFKYYIFKNISYNDTTVFLKKKIGLISDVQISNGFCITVLFRTNLINSVENVSIFGEDSSACKDPSH